jgi:hypothetical protein
LIFSLRNATWKHVAGAIGAIALTTIAWFIPMILTVGPEAYVSALVSLWVAVPGKVNIFNSSVMNSLARAVVIVSIFFLCFGTAAILAILRVRDDSSDNRNKRIFTSVWIAPGLLFFTFVYLKFVNSGYLLILMPPVCAWMGLWAARWYASPRVSKAFRISATGVCAAANAAIFIYCPVYCSYGAVRSFERELGVIVSVLPQIAPSEDTMIVGMDSHFLGYRHAGYYLPDYLTVQYPEVQLATGRRVFAMQNRDTRLAGGLNTSSMREFVIFPLPPGDAEYSDYMTTLRKRFPPGDIRLVTRGGLEFAIGPAQDLYLLFPVFAATINGTVYRK